MEEIYSPEDLKTLNREGNEDQNTASKCPFFGVLFSSKMGCDSAGAVTCRYDGQTALELRFKWKNTGFEAI